MTGNGFPWRLSELVEASHRIRPGAERVEGESRRVRWAPTERLVRYYTTLGLIDGPGELRGRTAFYGPRHLRQLLAIKQLQSHGASLRDVQARLTGLPDGDLESVAQLEPGWASGLGALESHSGDAEQPTEADSFWERAPRPVPPGRPGAPGASGSAWTGLSLGADLMVLVRDIPVEDIDREQLELLARPLVEFLGRRRGPAGGRA